MDIRAKSPVILLIILMLVFLSAAGTGFYLYQKEHTKNIELEEKIEEISTKQKITEAKFLEAQKILSSLEAKLNESSSQISDLTNELSKEKVSKEEAVSTLDQIRLELDQTKANKADLEDKLNQAQDDLRSMQNKLNSLQSDKKDLEQKLKDLEESSQGVELGKIVVSPEIAPAVATSKTSKQSATRDVQKEATAGNTLEGKVLVVNKEYNFVVMNLGSKDGVGMGQVFSIYRGKTLLGDVKVEKLHDSMAAAGFILEDTKDKVKEGDKVIKKG
jgi:myosin heavy subunit